MNILLAVDGSEVALRAVRSLIDHVRRFREAPAVHLLYVHPPIPVGLAMHPLSHDTLDSYYREEGEAALAPARRILEDAGLACTPHLHVGQPAEAIVARAQELGCTLICMGSHGHGALQNAILGSVATQVLHAANVPVLIVR